MLFFALLYQDNILPCGSTIGIIMFPFLSISKETNLCLSLLYMHIWAFFRYTLYVVEVQTYNPFSNWIFSSLPLSRKPNQDRLIWLLLLFCLSSFLFYCIYKKMEKKEKQKEYKINFEMAEVIELNICVWIVKCLSKVQLELLDSINIKTRRKSTVKKKEKIVIRSKWKMKNRSRHHG